VGLFYNAPEPTQGAGSTAANPLHATPAVQDGTDRQTPHHYTDHVKNMSVHLTLIHSKDGSRDYYCKVSMDDAQSDILHNTF